MRVSVIIPVYNGEKVIESTLNSLLFDKPDDVEVIVVNDGSKDKTKEVLDKYKDICVIHQENQGVSVARNTGIEHATGDYLLFIDADDLFISSMWNRIVELTNKFQSFICFSHLRKNEIEEKHVIYDRIFDSYKDNVQRYALEQFLMNYCWGKLYRSDIIEKYHIRYPKGIKYGEDQIFVNTYLQYEKDLTLVNEPILIYQINGNSAMHNLTFQRVSDSQEIFDSCVKLAESLGIENKSKMYIHILKNAIRYFVKKSQRKDKKVSYEEVKKLHNFQFYKDIMEDIKLSDYSLKNQLFILFVKYTNITTKYLLFVLLNFI